MRTVDTVPVATGRVDGSGRLVEADGPLASLQHACGGAIGDVLAVPELAELVAKASDFGLRLSRQFHAVDGRDAITAWVEIEPRSSAEGEIDLFELTISNWRTEERDVADAAALDEVERDVTRELAELIARLDARQCVVSVDSEAPDLSKLQLAMEAGTGRPWTDFVEFPGNAHEQPLHWRLLDKATCKVDGSRREWTVHLDPLGQDRQQPQGFILRLSSVRPLAEGEIGQTREPDVVPSLGRDLSPVLRQPINRIIANAETIRTKLAGPLADEYSNYAADIATAGQHLLSLIDDLSDLEVVESDDFVTAPDRIELADTARQACGILGVRAREKGIQLVPPAKGESQLAIAEFRRVLQILINLIGNAVRYTPEGSQIWVRLDRIGDRATICVADQGPGLDEEQQARIFDKFERLGRSGDGGSGLGLYISRRIARAMDGDLTVESAPGQGARFTLSVPAAEDLRAEPRDGPKLDPPGE